MLKNIKPFLKNEFLTLPTEKPNLPSVIGSIILLTGEGMESSNVGHENDGDTQRRFEHAVKLLLEQADQPFFVINGSDEQNHQLETTAKLRGVTSEKILLIPNPPLSNTMTQIKEISRRNLPQPYVFVTDPFHIPRVRRYVKKWLPESQSYYSFTNHSINEKDIQSEIEKIIKYANQGDLSL